MFDFLSNFFQKKHIDLFGVLPLSACRVVRPYLLERAGISDGSILILAIPYYTRAAAEKRNISAYAVPRDYHRFFASLFEELLPKLAERFPEERFAAFADHSPIDEIEAAARASLGVIGRNHMLITEKYSSYVFLGELVTTAHLSSNPIAVRTCHACGACMRACPAPDLGGVCLSALTQKKGDLTDAERAAIRRYGSAWGCDICQEACPYTKKALESGSIYSPIPFFEEHTISHLSTEILDNMNDEEFEKRAFAWRTRATVARNLAILESKEEEECST